MCEVSFLKHISIKSKVSYLFIGPSLTPIPTGVSSSAKGKMRKEVQDLMNLKYTNALSKFIEIVDTGYLNAGHC